MRIASAIAAAMLLAAMAAAQQPGSCREQAWAMAAQGDFRTAANAMALCASIDGTSSQNSADLTLLARLAQASHAIEQHDWPTARAAMQALAASAPPVLPSELNATLAPAFVRFGAGAPTAAATLARDPIRLHASATLAFQSFLRHEYIASLWRRLTLPAAALFLIVLLVSLAFGLRRALQAA